VSLITGYAPADAARDLASSSDSVSDYLLRGQSEQEILELSGRRELWSGIAPYIGDKPILGHGYLSSRVVLIDLISWGRRGGYAHNAVIQTLLDFGVVGLLLLWLPLVRALFPGPLLGPVDPELARTRATIFGVTLFLVVNSLSSESFAGAPGFEIFVVIAFAIAADRLATPRRRGRAPTPNYS
jgi:hypothetical protein